MRKNGVVVNPELIEAICRMGHGDEMLIADAGLPMPEGVQVLDLSLTRGIPGVMDVLNAVLEELVVEQITLAEEIKGRSPDLLQKIVARTGSMKPVFVPHEELKDRADGALIIVRTAEMTHYANILVMADAAF